MIQNQLIAGKILLARQKVSIRIGYEELVYAYTVSVNSPTNEVLEIDISDPNRTDNLRLRYRYEIDISAPDSDKSMNMTKALTFFRHEKDQRHLVQLLIQSRHRNGFAQKSDIEETCVTKAVKILMGFVYPYIDSMDFELKGVLNL